MQTALGLSRSIVLSSRGETNEVGTHTHTQRQRERERERERGREREAFLTTGPSSSYVFILVLHSLQVFPYVLSLLSELPKL